MATNAAGDLRLSLIAALEEKAADKGLDIVDVEVVGAKRALIIRVRIDHADPDTDPITLDEVSAETGWISDLLDECDPIEGSYTLEVSSPGMARPLRKRGDFARFAGERVRITTNATEGRRKFTGELLGITDDVVALDCDGERCEIDFETIKTAKICPTF